MFEKHRNTKSESTHTEPQQDKFASSANASTSVGKAAVIGVGIHIKGDIGGEENLIIEGKVDGTIRLDAHQVDVGQSGKVNADITAKVIKIAGEVRGDLTGMEKVVILRSGNVHGNIVAPRMTLEDGAIFKGSIDMDPGEPVKVKLAKPAVEKPVTAPKAVVTENAKDSGGYSLKGG
jgi:cytoskeletal protein CcmA (bactofilin family)